LADTSPTKTAETIPETNQQILFEGRRTLSPGPIGEYQTSWIRSQGFQGPSPTWTCW